jgi:hypothetical protein
MIQMTNNKELREEIETFCLHHGLELANYIQFKNGAFVISLEKFVKAHTTTKLEELAEEIKKNSRHQWDNPANGHRCINCGKVDYDFRAPVDEICPVGHKWNQEIDSAVEKVKKNNQIYLRKRWSDV